MGWEVTTTVRIDVAEAKCCVLHETSEIIVRGEMKRKLPRAEMSRLQSSDGWLSFLCRGEAIMIDLGEKAAAKWLDALKNPRTRIQKLGIERGMKLCLLNAPKGEAVDDIIEGLDAPPLRRIGRETDLVVFFANERSELDRLMKIEPDLAIGGALWVLWPKKRKNTARDHVAVGREFCTNFEVSKGEGEITHEDVVGAAKSAGLVQSRSMGFSDEFTALRLVRPVKGNTKAKTKAKTSVKR